MDPHVPRALHARVNGNDLGLPPAVGQPASPRRQVIGQRLARVPIGQHREPRLAPRPRGDFPPRRGHPTSGNQAVNVARHVDPHTADHPRHRGNRPHPSLTPRFSSTQTLQRVYMLCIFVMTHGSLSLLSVSGEHQRTSGYHSVASDVARNRPHGRTFLRSFACSGVAAGRPIGPRPMSRADLPIPRVGRPPAAQLARVQCRAPISPSLAGCLGSLSPLGSFRTFDRRTPVPPPTRKAPTPPPPQPPHPNLRNSGNRKNATKKRGFVEVRLGLIGGVGLGWGVGVCGGVCVCGCLCRRRGVVLSGLLGGWVSPASASGRSDRYRAPGGAR